EEELEGRHPPLLARHGASVYTFVVVPAPAAPIPHEPAALVARLDATTRALDAAIDRWDRASAPPRDVALLALYQQRVLRLLARDERLAAGALRLRPSLADDVVARRELIELTPAAPGH